MPSLIAYQSWTALDDPRAIAAELVDHVTNLYPNLNKVGVDDNRIIHLERLRSTLSKRKKLFFTLYDGVSLRPTTTYLDAESFLHFEDQVWKTIFFYSDIDEPTFFRYLVGKFPGGLGYARSFTRSDAARDYANDAATETREIAMADLLWGPSWWNYLADFGPSAYPRDLYSLNLLRTSYLALPLRGSSVLQTLERNGGVCEMLDGGVNAIVRVNSRSIPHLRQALRPRLFPEEPR